MQALIARRRVLGGTGAALLLGGLEGCATSFNTRGRPRAPQLQLVPVRASTDRITRITVCTRPFRARGRVSMRNRSVRSSWSITTATAAAAGLCPGDRAASRSESPGERRTRHGGHRLRRNGTDLGAAAAASRGAGHDLRQGPAAECPIILRQRSLDSRLQHLSGGKCHAGIQAAVGADGPHLLSDLSELSGIAGHAGRVHRQLFCFRRRRHAAVAASVGTDEPPRHSPNCSGS